MSIITKSVFYFGHIVDETNNFIDFDEGGGELSAELNLGSFSLTEFAIEISRALSLTGGQEYTVIVDRDTRVLTISAPAPFEILGSTVSHTAIDALSLAGFLPADTGSATSHIGDSPSGSEFKPQFFLQRYVDFDDIEEAAAASVNESASGIVEVVSFALRNFMECNIKFQTDISMGTDSDIETNLSGVSNLRDFLKAITKKSTIEFMKDRDTRSDFVKCLLESTGSSRQGTGFRLKELYSMGLPNFFETGTLRFRKVN